MNFKKYFKHILIKRFPESYGCLLLDIDHKYYQISIDINFSKTSKNPLDKRLDLMAYFLATIQSLQGNKVDPEQIKNICIEVATLYVKPKNRLHKWLKKLPPKLINTHLASIFLKILDKKISHKSHDDGFLAKVIMDKQATYGFGYGIDILECGICKLFNKHDAGKFTPILCEVDKITSSLADLELIREGTIANGANKCDFRFRKNSNMK